MTETKKKTVEAMDGVSDNNLVRKSLIKGSIAGRKKKENCDLLKKGYKEMAAVNLEWAQACLEADNKCQLEYEEKLSECE